MLQVRIYQTESGENSSIDRSFDLEFGTSVRNVRKIVGTALREVFHRMDYYRANGSRLVKCNAPLYVQFTSKGQIIDLGAEWNADLREKLKCGYGAKQRITYASRVMRQCQEALSMAERLESSTDFDTLMAQLEEQAKREEKA